VRGAVVERLEAVAFETMHGIAVSAWNARLPLPPRPAWLSQARGHGVLLAHAWGCMAVMTSLILPHHGDQNVEPGI
jgi:hypothetical protein